MELQDIVRRLRMKQSIKAIKRETGKHRRVIRRVLELAWQEGWLDAAGRGARAAIGTPTPGGISRAARRRGWPLPPARRSPRPDRGMARGWLQLPGDPQAAARARGGVTPRPRYGATSIVTFRHRCDQ